MSCNQQIKNMEEHFKSTIPIDLREHALELFGNTELMKKNCANYQSPYNNFEQTKVLKTKLDRLIQEHKELKKTMDSSLDFATFEYVDEEKEEKIKENSNLLISNYISGHNQIMETMNKIRRVEKSELITNIKTFSNDVLMATKLVLFPNKYDMQDLTFKIMACMSCLSRYDKNPMFSDQTKVDEINEILDLESDKKIQEKIDMNFLDYLPDQFTVSAYDEVRHLLQNMAILVDHPEKMKGDKVHNHEQDIKALTSEMLQLFEKEPMLKNENTKQKIRNIMGKAFFIPQ